MHAMLPRRRMIIFATEYVLASAALLVPGVRAETMRAMKRQTNRTESVAGDGPKGGPTGSNDPKPATKE